MRANPAVPLVALAQALAGRPALEERAWNGSGYVDAHCVPFVSCSGPDISEEQGSLRADGEAVAWTGKTDGRSQDPAHRNAPAAYPNRGERLRAVRPIGRVTLNSESY